MCVQGTGQIIILPDEEEKEEEEEEEGLIIIILRVPSVTQTLERIDNNDKGSFVM